MCPRRFLAHENICLDIKIAKIRPKIAEIYDKTLFSVKKIKMAAKHPRWPPKKCQPYFLYNLTSNQHKKISFGKCTKKFDERKKQHLRAYTTTARIRRVGRYAGQQGRTDSCCYKSTAQNFF